MDFKAVCGLAVSILWGLSGTPLHAFEAADQFDHDTISRGVWQTVGRGPCSIEDGILRVRDGSVTAGDAEWNHYSLKFRARAVDGAAQVRIWAGFRHYNRDSGRNSIGAGTNVNEVYFICNIFNGV
jgi:hypothetical protein